MGNDKRVASRKQKVSKKDERMECGCDEYIDGVTKSKEVTNRVSAARWLDCDCWQGSCHQEGSAPAQLALPTTTCATTRDNDCRSGSIFTWTDALQTSEELRMLSRIQVLN